MNTEQLLLSYRSSSFFVVTCSASTSFLIGCSGGVIFFFSSNLPSNTSLFSGVQLLFPLWLNLTLSEITILANTGELWKFCGRTAL